MKYKSVLKNLTLFMLVICAVLVCVFNASAVDDVSPDNDFPVETQAEENPEEVIPEPETEFVPQETETPEEEETDAPAYEPEQNEQETDSYIENITETPQDEENQAQNQEENNEGGQEAVQNNTVQTKPLPTIAPSTEKRVVNKDDLTYGYVSWACVAAGILVLMIVFISIKASGIKSGRKRR